MDTAKEYLGMLAREYEERVAQNPSYSLNAFARRLGLSSARLSEILNGKQGLSLSWAARIADRLGLGPEEKVHFCDLVDASHARSQAQRRAAQLRLQNRKNGVRRTLELDAFNVVADWYHLAITELATLDGFQNDSKWIAKRLGIPQKAVTLAIERLLRLGLLVKDGKTGRLVADPDTYMTPDGVPSAAIRKFHRQVLERALLTIEEEPVTRRSLSAVLFSFDQSKFAKADKLIRDFRRSFTKTLGPVKKKDSVYCLSIQFFPLDKGDPR